MTGKRLILHLGYHQTGADLIRHWLDDHADILSPHLAVYGPDNPLTEALRTAAQDLARGRHGAAETLALAAQDLANALQDQSAPVALLSDEDLLGPPLGHVEQGYVETEIYPGLCPILNVLGRELAAFDPLVALFKRPASSWLAEMHRRAVHQGSFAGEFNQYLAYYEPQPDWAGLRDEIRFALQDRARLAIWPFKKEFAQGTVAQMGLFKALKIPQPLLARCRPELQDISAPAAQPAEATPDTPGTVPHVLLMGGANAMAGSGWGQLLRRDYTALIKTRNLSTAAGTSATALYRLLTEGARWPGAPVIWEQGVNEFAHMTGGQSLDSLLYHVEWLLQICAREGRSFVPLLTHSRAQAGQAAPDPYVTAVHRLFANYGLNVLDTQRLIKVMERGTATAINHWYTRNAFYDTKTELPQRMAETVLMALPGARVPLAPPDRAAHFDPLTLRLRTPAETPEEFDLAGGACRFAPYDQGLSLAVPGRALAAILVTGGHGPVIRFTAGETDLGVYVTQAQQSPGQPPLQLRQLILAQGAGGVEIPGGVVQIGVDNSQAKPIIQTMFHQGEPPSGPQPTGLVAILSEEPREGAV